MLDTNNSKNNQIQDLYTALHLLHIGPKDRNGVSPVWSKLETIVPVKLG
jgi:hypothetical protein